MTDRELLELAAKAAGYIYVEDSFCQREGLMMINFSMWNPTADDGDALRLEVDLNMTTKHVLLDFISEENELCSGDYRKARRRAIVRAAAEIGKTMP